MKELFMFYNVENLFCPDPEKVHKTDPTPSGLSNWNQYRYSNKIHKIAHVFELVEAQYGMLPAIIGLAEIQGKEVLKDLLNRDVFHNYGYVHYDSMDERGIDVALLYDKNKVHIEFSEPISYTFKIENSDAYDTTRDVLHAKVRFYDEILNVFVLHLPSKREQDINRPKRAHILKEIGNKIGNLFTVKNEAVIVLGDFNENPDDEIMKNLTFYKDFNKILTNPWLDLYKNNSFSTFHYKSGLLFDQILLSAQFFKPGFLFSFRKASVFNPEKISSWDRKFTGRPFRTYAGTRYLGGYSDHFPVITELEKNIN
ncbi:MAG: endonuclease [Bergeyella sp.]